MTAKQHYERHLGNFYSWMAGDFRTLQQSFENFLKEHNIYPVSNKVALDLGAGHGVQSVSLANIGFRVKAIDFNEQLLAELAVNTKGLPVEVIPGDMRQFKDYVTDIPEIIICWGDTLTHLENKAEIHQFLRNASTILPEGGKLLLSFRDYTHELQDDSRFIPVKSDEQRILTCFLEYFPEYIRVTDLLYEKNGLNWEQKISSYTKVRIAPDKVIQLLQNGGLYIYLHDVKNGMVRIIAQKQ